MKGIILFMMMAANVTVVAVINFISVLLSLSEKGCILEEKTELDVANKKVVKVDVKYGHLDEGINRALTDKRCADVNVYRKKCEKSHCS